VRATVFSWPRTGDLIEDELERLDVLLEQPLAAVAELNPDQRRRVYEKFVSDYRTLESNHRTIDRHIQYNRFWQSAIIKDRDRFDLETVLHDAALERQRLLDALAAGERPTAELRRREAELARRIHRATSTPQRRSYLRFRQQPPGVRWLEVKIYTDIGDQQFLAAFARAVESAWQARDGETHWRLRLKLEPLPLARLYPPESGKQPPRPGQVINQTRHCARFPADGGVLTTGGRTTHVALGRCVVLGPQAVKPRTLAHEFGHVLGFRDLYFRGYADLGDDGLQVSEVVPDPADLMSSPRYGRVHPYHFRRLAGVGR
jgi:hypothetical protein